MKNEKFPEIRGRQDIEALAQRFAALFPHYDAKTADLAIALYRLLGQGAPVSYQRLARVSALPVERVRALLSAWPGVFHEAARITGFGGLSVRAASGHQLRIGQRILYAQCALDTLFIPAILGERVEVLSACPVTGRPVRLTVTPHSVTDLTPASALLSMLFPQPEMMGDIVRRFCGQVHFFVFREAAERWLAGHPEALLMTVADGFALGRRLNELRAGHAAAPLR